MTNKQHKGFTLIELMIVVAIVGILAAIAYPNYTEYVRRSARVECEGTMLATANALQRRFTAPPNSYVGALPAPARCPADGGTQTYTLTPNPIATATSFVITATPMGGQINDRCGILTLSDAGVKTNSAGLPLNQCWR